MKKRLKKKKTSNALKKYLPVFENMFTPIIQIAEHFNPSEYRTHEARLRESVEKQVQGVSENKDTGEALKKLFLSIDFGLEAKKAKKELKKELDERAEKDNRFPELNKLANEIDSKLPNMSFIPLFVINPIELFVRAFEPNDLIEEYKNLKGERAARTLIRIYREVAELLYYDYLKAIFQLVQLLEGKPQIRIIEKFGTLANQLPKRLEKLGYHTLVDPDAGWIRNAACHGHWKYKPENDSLILWDDKKPEQEISVKDLYEKTMSLYSMVLEVYLPFILYYLKGKMFNEWLDFLKFFQKNFTALLNGDTKKVQQLEKILEEEFFVIKQLEFKQLKKNRD